MNIFEKLDFQFRDPARQHEAMVEPIHSEKFILTEAGETLVTEAGEPIMTQKQGEP